MWDEKVAVKMATCPSNDLSNEIKKPKKDDMAKRQNDKKTKRQEEKKKRKKQRSILWDEKVAVKRATCRSNDPDNEIKTTRFHHVKNCSKNKQYLVCGENYFIFVLFSLLPANILYFVCGLAPVGACWCAHGEVNGPIFMYSLSIYIDLTKLYFIYLIVLLLFYGLVPVGAHMVKLMGQFLFNINIY